MSPIEINFVVPGNPVPKQRARAGKHGFYTPTKTRQFEQLVGRTALAARVAAMMAGVQWPLDKTARYRVECTFYYKDRRGYDSDNTLKSIQDGAERVLWLNDRQCTEGSYITRISKEDPRSEIRAIVLA